MASLPQLKSGAVMQYPVARTLQYRSQTLRFLDGNEQRYRDAAGPLHRWTIRLDALDATELTAIRSFFNDNQGRYASFAFTDPWTGTSYPNCSIAGDTATLLAKGDFANAVSIAIVENRS